MATKTMALTCLMASNGREEVAVMDSSASMIQTIQIGSFQARNMVVFIERVQAFSRRQSLRMVKYARKFTRPRAQDSRKLRKQA